MGSVNCPQCLQQHRAKCAMWKVPLGPDRWLFRCPVCTLMLAMVVTDNGDDSGPEIGLDIPQIPGETWEEDWEIVAEN